MFGDLAVEKRNGMGHVTHGIHEAALTLAYNSIVLARSVYRRIARPTEVGVRVLTYHGGSVVLVRHRGGRWPWSLPGGGMNAGEGLAEAARREMWEEAGCDAEIQGLLGVYHSVYQGMSNVTAVFVCQTRTPPRPPRGDLEIVDARLFQRGDLPASLEPGSLRRIVEHERGAQGLYGPW
ncbi:MAG: NUDIX domain-containing protein [Chloroflexi bacterium OHK40]